jgi:hypothetical protein
MIYKAKFQDLQVKILILTAKSQTFNTPRQYKSPE